MSAYSSDDTQYELEEETWNSYEEELEESDYTESEDTYYWL